VVVHTVVLWHKYTQAGRVGEMLGSKKLHMLAAAGVRENFRALGRLEGLPFLDARRGDDFP